MVEAGAIWIIERSIDGGETWAPLQQAGFKVRRETAENLAAKDNSSYARYRHLIPWRERAVRYLPDRPSLP